MGDASDASDNERGTAQRRGQPPQRAVVGWREYVALPEWGAAAVKTKIDTGARTSAIDVAQVQELSGDRVRFQIVTNRGTVHERITVEADIVRRTKVKSSFGTAHDRLVVQTRMILGPIDKVIELSLVSRPRMLCRMLLGRTALEPETLVDPGRRYLHGKATRRRKAAP